MRGAGPDLLAALALPLVGNEDIQAALGGGRKGVAPLIEALAVRGRAAQAADLKGLFIAQAP